MSTNTIAAMRRLSVELGWRAAECSVETDARGLRSAAGELKDRAYRLEFGTSRPAVVETVEDERREAIEHAAMVEAMGAYSRR